MPSPPEVSIVIVNYNSGIFLPQCFESILAQTIPYEVILVDNASADGSLERIPVTENMQVLRNAENLGFAKAQNQGMRLARGKYVLPMNPDIILEPDCLEEMVRAMLQGERIGTVAPKLLRMNARLEKTNQFDNAGLLLPAGRIPYHRGRDETDAGQYDQPVRMFGAMGAAALYRRNMLEDIAYKGQYFDESFFTWYEDIDLDWRARLRGWECAYAPRAVAYHVGDPHGHGRSKFGAMTSMRNRWMMILANECPRCFVMNSQAILKEEFGLIKHIIKHGLYVSYLRALASWFAYLPQVIKKRKFVQSRAIQKCLPEYPLPFEVLA